MKYLKLFLGTLALSVMLITGCKKEAGIDPEQSLDALKNSAKSSANFSPVLNAKLDLLLASLPAGFQEKLKENERIFLTQHPQYRAFVRNALVPTPCDANTILYQWLDIDLADWSSDAFYYAFYSGIVDLPTYDALLFENSSANQYFGLEGEHSQQLTKSLKDLNRFWNIQSGGIVMVAMHGNMLQDREKVIRIYRVLTGNSLQAAESYADFVQLLLEVFPQYRNGNHPIFTFNAFALETFNFPPFGVIPDKIVMGDGLMDAYTGLGFDDVAPQAILAHEFGHHIQIQLDLFPDEDSPEGTRRTELMADAYSAYYLSHSRGAAMQWKRVRQFLEVFYNIGDCAFTNNGHHGTPTQRMAAADWGYSVANDAQKQGHILTSQEFTALFEAQLPILVTY